MKDVFDYLEEEDLLRNLPEALPQMEDETAAKRIEKMALEKLQAEAKQQKKWQKRRILIAAVCCLVAVGAFARKPIAAYFQRILHYLPGVGVYINDTDAEIYEVQIDNPVQEKDGVRVELKGFYCENNMLKGDFVFTGEGLPTEKNGKDEIVDELSEKYEVTYYYGEKSRVIWFSGCGWHISNEGKVLQYTPHCSERLYLKDGCYDYAFSIKGFDEKIHLKVVKAKTTENPEDLGYSVTKNGTSLIAKANLDGDTIQLEYYQIPSAEVAQAMEDWFHTGINIYPYQFEKDSYVYILNGAGERMSTQYDSLENGGKFILEGTERDFPLTLHRTAYTGTDKETHDVEIPLTEGAELPRVKFHYGTVEFLSAAQEDTIYDNPYDEIEEPKEATKITVRYRTLPAKGIRKMYAVNLDYADEEQEFGRIPYDSSEEEKDGILVQEDIFYLPRGKWENITLTLKNPSYWVGGSYDVVIEKPRSKK